MNENRQKYTDLTDSKETMKTSKGKTKWFFHFVCDTDFYLLRNMQFLFLTQHDCDRITG